MSLLINIRSIFEPFNQSRVFHGFDTFDSFPAVDIKDGVYANTGDYKSTNYYEVMLADLLRLHEGFAPMNDLVTHKLIKGDASITIDKWLDDNPQTLFRWLYLIWTFTNRRKMSWRNFPRLTRGSLLVFDELNCEFFPGETRALNEVQGLNNLRLYIAVTLRMGGLW